MMAGEDSAFQAQSRRVADNPEAQLLFCLWAVRPPESAPFGDVARTAKPVHVTMSYHVCVVHSAADWDQVRREKWDCSGSRARDEWAFSTSSSFCRG